jgi:TDG/mug DNA glycosylase family protein
MNWTNIKNSIKNDLNSRGLSNPNIRLNALNNLEDILKKHFSTFIQNNCEKFREIDKKEFKLKIAKYKSNGQLNSAESSIINEIYYRISPINDNDKIIDTNKVTINNKENEALIEPGLRKKSTHVIVSNAIINQVEGLAPIENEKSKVLILGTMPGVESLKQQAYYGNSQNVFWKLLAEITGKTVPDKYEDKKLFLINNNIALWDICKTCIRNGSLDSNITQELPNDINRFILEHPHIKIIAFNGKESARLFNKHIVSIENIKVLELPSTSPANTTVSWEKKVEAWKRLKEFI